MHGNSPADHGQVQPLSPPGDGCFATVLLVEAQNAAAQAVRVSLEGVLGDALHFERVAGLAEASARLASGTVEVILVGRSLSDCGREQALMRLGLRAPEALILPSSTPDPGGTAAESAMVLRAILELGHRLGHAVIAQGVETEEQLAFLQAEGCAVGHGFHLGGAGDASDTAQLLAPPPPPARAERVQ